MADDELTAAELEMFNNNFNKLKDEVNPDDTVKQRKAIPADSNPNDLPPGVMGVIARLTEDQVTVLNELAVKAESHIFLYDHSEDTRKRGRVIAMGL